MLKITAPLCLGPFGHAGGDKYKNHGTLAKQVVIRLKISAPWCCGPVGPTGGEG